MADNTALSTAEQNALVVSYDVLGSHVELTLDFVKRYLVRGRADLTSDQELMFFMNTCKMQKLNPLVQGDAYLVKYSEKEPAQLVIGKDRYLRRAHDHPDYICKEDGITVQRGSQIIQKEGCCIYPGEVLVGGWCRVHYVRRNVERTAFKEVALSEYDRGMANWKSKPATMINKVAISQCVRDAFPKDFEGLYSEDELIASGVIQVDENGEVSTPDKPAPITPDKTAPITTEQVVAEEDPIITPEQRRTLFNTAKSAFGDEGNDIVKQLIREIGYEATTNLTASAFKKVMGMLFDLSDKKQAEEAQKSCETPEEPDENVEE